MKNDGGEATHAAMMAAAEKAEAHEAAVETMVLMPTDSTGADADGDYAYGGSGDGTAGGVDADGGDTN